MARSWSLLPILAIGLTAACSEDAPDRVEPPVVSTWEQAAGEVVRDISDRAERSGSGAQWTIVEVQANGSITRGPTPDFYTGAAGILAFLSEYHRQHPSEALAALIRDGARALAARAQAGLGSDGLYVGLAGLGRMYLQMDKALPGEGWLEQARQIAARLGGNGPGLDIISGISGEGLFLLELHQADGDERWLRAASERGNRLLALAVPEGRGAKWPVGVDFPAYYPGLSHGTAGVGLFLAQLAGALGPSGGRYREGALRAAAWLEQIAVPGSNGSLSWWRRQPDQMEQFQHQWCHGTGGIVLFFLEMAKLTGDARYRQVAVAAGQALYAAGKHWSPAYCHGNTGNAATLLALHQATGDAQWRDRAEELVQFAWDDRVLMSSGHLRWESADGSGAMNPSFMVGSAGIGHVFLQMSAAGGLGPKAQRTSEPQLSSPAEVSVHPAHHP